MNIFFLTLSKILCCKCQTVKKRALTNYFKEGKERIIKELDCVEVVNKLRIVDLLYLINFDKVTKLLNKLQKAKMKRKDDNSDFSTRSDKTNGVFLSDFLNLHKKF
mmetsp:Transcript_20551/g.19532  ORF Transcript_20551/g.19532 Transcript_20551/m.19532 type:complete len:106 (-) Transcript_20551:392-709(-)